MKNRYIILFTVLITVSLFSCTPQYIMDDSDTIQQTEECCGEDGGINPPPPTLPNEGKAMKKS